MSDRPRPAWSWPELVAVFLLGAVAPTLAFLLLRSSGFLADLYGAARVAALQSLQAMQCVRLVTGAGTPVYLVAKSASCVEKKLSSEEDVQSAQLELTWTPISKPAASKAAASAGASGVLG